MILLVHGAWHGAWCWTPVVAALESRGISVCAIDLPGHGAKRNLALDVGLQDYISAVVDAAAGMEAPPLLVGHSMGGMVISAAAERQPALFRSLAYLAAFVPANGETLGQLAQSAAPPFGRVQEGEIHLERDEAQKLFYNDCSQKLANWALDQIHPEPLRPATQPTTLSPERFGSLRKDYLLCENDLAIYPAFQDKMAKRANITRIVKMDSGHSPFLSRSEQLATLLMAML